MTDHALTDGERTHLPSNRQNCGYGGVSVQKSHSANSNDKFETGLEIF